MKPIVLNGSSLTVRETGEAARGARPVRLDPDARAAVNAGRRLVERAVAERKTVYGVDTGFGDLAQVSIPAEDLAALQLNLLRSHAVGTGDPLDPPAVRAMLVAKANALLKGHGGVRWELPERLIALLGAGILPVVPSIGSIGASGDLAPLAHLSLPLVGEGEVWVDGRRKPAAEALREAGIEPLRLGPKEGLGLINGTQGITALLALALDEMERTAAHAEVAAALSTDALQGTDTAFHPALHRARPHPGAGKSAERLRRLLEGSEIRGSHRYIRKTQDAYSIRCAPTVIGAARDALERARETAEIELNAATGNPLCFPAEDRILSGGNFHGEPVALAADFAAIAAAEIGAIAERRVARLVDPKLSELPPYLAREPGLHSGYMVAQYAAAALASENKVWCHPASVDSIPTSGNQEDHVSMGFHGARKARTVAENVKRIVAIELILAAQGVEFHRPRRTGGRLERAMEALRGEIAPLEEDRPFSSDLDRALALMDRGTILEAAEIEL